MENLHHGSSVSSCLGPGDATSEFPSCSHAPAGLGELHIHRDQLQWSREAERGDWSSQVWGHQYTRDWNTQEQAQGKGCEEGLGIRASVPLGDVGSSSLDEVGEITSMCMRTWWGRKEESSLFPVRKHEERGTNWNAANPIQAQGKKKNTTALFGMRANTEQVAQIDCRVFILGDTQNPAGHGLLPAEG